MAGTSTSTNGSSPIPDSLWNKSKAGIFRSLIFHPDDLQAFLDRRTRALENGEAYEGEYRLKRASDGTYRWHLARGVPVKDANGHIVNWVGTSTDIEDQKQAEAAAESANRAKSDFLSGMSHELRSPLNAILGFTQLMASDSPPPTPSQQASIDQILRAGWHLLELINEVLDLAKIESGQVSLSQEPVSLAEVTRECQEMIGPQAQQRGMRMSFPRFDLPCFVHGDRTRVKQILINLLSNAIKYNRAQGTVEVTCSARTPERMCVSVRDTGAGLPPDKLAQLFQPFNRLGQEAGAEEGTGIGLVVAKRLVELMGGRDRRRKYRRRGKRVLVRTTLDGRATSDDWRSRTRRACQSASSEWRVAAYLALCRGQPGEPGTGRTTHRAPHRDAPADRGEWATRHRAGAHRAAGGDRDGHQSA
ncbi:sensor histidine kinase [Undibacterium arcticum]